MNFLGNILWFLLGGFVSGISWIISGILCCITIVGIPLGLQCFKFASLSFFPFGKEVYYDGGAISFIANIIWLICCGLPMAIHNFVLGCILYITIIGIPFARQHFKLAALALRPFGARVV